MDRALTKHYRPDLPALPGAAVGAALFLPGYFAPSEYVSGGFSSFGVNLNTFWTPVSRNWPTWDAGYRHLGWSRFLPACRW